MGTDSAEVRRARFRFKNKLVSLDSTVIDLSAKRMLAGTRDVPSVRGGELVRDRAYRSVYPVPARAGSWAR